MTGIRTSNNEGAKAEVTTSSTRRSSEGLGDFPTQHHTIPDQVFPIPVEDQPVGGRLAFYWQNWQSIGADAWVLKILKEGYRLEFSKNVPLARNPTIDSTPQNSVKLQAMDELISNLLDKAVIEQVHNSQSAGHYSRFFIIPKKNTGKWRAILDLKQLNQGIEKQKFKMETAQDIRDHLQMGEWATSIDLTDAYHHVPIHKADRKYLRFYFKGQVYQYKALVMGLTSSPRIFTRVIKVLKEFLHKHSIVVHQYLDDWLTHASSQSIVSHHTQILLEITQQLGFLVNLDKSDLQPTQDCTYLAYRFRLDHGLVGPTQERWMKIQRKIHLFLEQEVVTAVQWQSMIGLLASTEKLVRVGMLHLRPVQMGLLEQWNPFRDHPQAILPISTTVRNALQWWTVYDNVMTGVPIRPMQPQHQIFTDASMEGWGGHWKEQVIQGSWNVEEQTMHINMLELLAVWRVLEHFATEFEGCTVMAASDNTSDNDGGIHQEARGDQVTQVTEAHSTTVRLVGTTPDITKVQTHPGPAQCAGRLTVQGRPDHSDGMVHTSTDPKAALECMGSTQHRHVCYQGQLQAPDIRLTDTGSASLCSRCAITGVGGDVHVRLPTNGNNSTGPGEVTNTQLQCHSHSSSVAKATVVSNNPGVTSRFSTGDSTCLIFSNNPDQTYFIGVRRCSSYTLGDCQAEPQKSRVFSKCCT